MIRNNDTAVLGGLAREAEQEEVKKVPILGDIPVVGWLFKSNITTKEKLNLMVFLTPKIIRNPEDQKRVVGGILDERTQFIKDTGGKDPYGRKMDQVRNYVPDSQGNVIDRGTSRLDLNSPTPRPDEIRSAPMLPTQPSPSHDPTPAEMEDSTLE